jgi:hypothetical protein
VVEAPTLPDCFCYRKRLVRLFTRLVVSILPFVRRADPFLYVVWAGALTLVSARAFYGYMLKQTGGEWSAPLDDVFIHFDYARATALGHPFEWTVGNGYSSGNTSLTYPFVLALGWLVGFTGPRLVVWAGIVATTSVFATLLATRRLFLEGPRDDWGRLSSYLLPPIFLGVGALVWSLWSGMEVAFFLACWALALVAWQRLEGDARAPGRDQRAMVSATWLGLAGALLVATRPEAAMTIAVFGLAGAHAHRRAGKRRAALLLLLAGAPSVLVLVAQAVANKVLTGESSANGAIVKLALNNPYMTGEEKLADWIGNVRYAVLRNLDYHFAHIQGEHLSELVPTDWPPTNPLAYLARTAWWAGAVPLAIATLPLLFARTRRVALVLWAQVVLWIVVVALNGQVRWQNERYVMPAVAWMLVLVALGVQVAFRARTRTLGRGTAMRPHLALTVVVFALVVQTVGVLTRPAGTEPSFRLPWLLAVLGGCAAYGLLRPRITRMAVVAVALLFAYDHQIPKMRDQKWFFGRASRNIRDQHMRLGRYLAEISPRRVLVGDAGAILYESDRPGLDIIGLGGYGGLPFARAGVHGLPATLELIERIPDADRPDVLAILPTWWGVLPAWFAGEVMRRFPAPGNVICGGYEHVVYRADWRLLGTGDRLRAMPEGDRVVRAEIDVGDLVSERESEYVFERPSNGWTDMRILPDPEDERRDLFDGGRRIAPGRRESFVASGLEAGRPAHLVVRSAPEKATRVRVLVDGVEIGTLTLERTGGWVEAPIAIPRERVKRSIHVELVNDGPGDFLDFHDWVTQ